jgi:hypothetical protein
LLHCLFILIQVSLDDPVVVFNFIAILVTEIIPSIILLFSQITLKSSGTKKNGIFRNFDLLTKYPVVSSTTSETETATMDTSSTTGTGTSTTGMSTYSNSTATEEDL